MRLNSLFAVATAIAVSPAACGQFTAPGGNMTFTVGKAELGGPGDRAVASSSDGTIIVDGHISTPDPCQDVRGALTNAGGELILSVIARSKSGACVTAIGLFPYRAVVRDVAAGSYRVHVLYRYEKTGWPVTTALDTVVTVP